jgi:hypothetical protein
VVLPSRQATSSGFFSIKHGLANTVQTSTPRALLSSDQHYEHSYTNERCVPAACAVHVLASYGM